MNGAGNTHPGPEENPVITIMQQGQKDVQFTFQDPPKFAEFRLKGSDAFDELKAERKDDPLPKIESFSTVPEVRFAPDIRIREDLNLSGVPTLDKSLLNAARGPSNSIGGQTGLPFYGTGDKFSGSFTRHIEGVREMGLDVVFIFDATSSMAEFLRQAKTKIANLVMTFKALVPTARIGLVAYRDRGDDFVTKSFPLTHKTQQLKQFLKGIDPAGGSDYAEAVDEGLRVAIDEFNWGKNSKKIILVIGDAPPHREDMQKATDLVEKFRNQMGGMVATLDISSPGSQSLGRGAQRSAMPEFKQLAQAGGGESARIVDEEKVIKQMVVLAFGTKWEAYLDEFLKNL
jgi:Mg-chelatase subunit ChlD